MISTKTILEVKKDERVYQLIVDPMSPLGELYDVVCEMKSFIFHKIEEVEKQKEKTQQE